MVCHGQFSCHRGCISDERYLAGSSADLGALWLWLHGCYITTYFAHSTSIGLSAHCVGVRTDQEIEHSDRSGGHYR